MTLVETNEPWLGKVPDDWRRSRIRNEALLSPGFSSSPPAPSEPCAVVPMESISTDGAIDLSNQLPFAEISPGLTMFEPGDVLFAKITPCMENGKGAFVQELPTRYAFGTTEFHVLRPSRRLDGRFLYYATFNPTFRAYAAENMTGAAGQKRVPSRFLKDTRLFLPPLPEQQRIAAYLDASCAAIDAAVAAKRRQLETLDALRLTVIREATTRGITAGIRMKDSSIDWLPQIPAHWGAAKLKRHTEIIRGQFMHRPRSDPAFYGGPYPFIQTASISAADKFITEFSQTLNEEGLRISKMFPKDTVVMSITGAKIAEVAVTTFDACFPDSIVGFVPHHHLNRDFLYYLLVAMKPALLRAAVVTTQPNINYVQIGGNYIPLPPVKEQALIAAYIEEKIQNIRTVRASLETQLATLTAYRKSLIHECVTGQRRITEAGLEKTQHTEATR
ncbi:MAG: restriction endonuclease subunit S [Verrucomicrobia bacterium]|nr:restriction endonuclease subunit S [Verrucomicrobiota bacterium]